MALIDTPISLPCNKFDQKRLKLEVGEEIEI